MDEIISAALKKWPNVPHCYGWLGLDSRGQWWMRGAEARAAGSFLHSRASMGSILRHEKLLQFIGQNYMADALGQWYFQNGPQRVYVELESAPWVLRLQNDGSLLTHTGRVALAQKNLVDEAGKLYVVSDLGLGLVHSHDVALAAEYLENGSWLEPETTKASELALRYGFVKTPSPKLVHTTS